MSDELREAVDALTRPIVDHIPQIDDAGKWLRAHTVQHPPLLQQLSDAITSAIGKGGGGGNPANDVLNGDALERAQLIRVEITSWGLMLRLKSSPDMVADLIRWQGVFIQTGRDTDFYVRMMRKWESQITGLLDPPKRLEVTVSCPLCGADKFTDAEGKALPFPIVIEYRRESPLAASGICRACLNVWTGERELRQLRWEIDTLTG